MYDIRHRADWKLTAIASFRYGVGLLIVSGGLALLFPSLVITPRFFPLNISGCVLIMLAPTACLYVASVALRNRWNPSLVAMVMFVLIVSASLSVALSHVPQVKYPLVNENRVVDQDMVWSSLGPTAIMGLIAVPYVLITSWRRADARQDLVPLVFAGSIGLLWIRTYDFGYLVPQFVAVLTTMLVVGVARWLQPRLGTWELRVTALAFALSLVVLIWPLRWVSRSWYVHRPEMMLVHDGWIQAMHWLRDMTPKPSVTPTSLVEDWERGVGFEYPRDTYGVLCSWDHGNFISAMGRRIPLSSRFPIKRTAQLLFGPSVPETTDDLCSGCKDGEGVRYVVIDARTVSDFYPAKVHMVGRKISMEVKGMWKIQGRELPRAVFGEEYRQSLAVRLYLDDGKQLGHYRLVYESPSEHCLAYRAQERRVERTSVHIESPSHRQRALRWISQGSVVPTFEGIMYDVLYDPVLVPSVKIFEHVSGAVVTGTYSSGSKIEAHLKLNVRTTGRSFVYVQSTRADEQGRFELTLPYATGVSSPASVAVAEGPYQLRLNAEAEDKRGVSSLNLSEKQVAHGERVDLGHIN